jgi:hypothetical protein
MPLFLDIYFIYRYNMEVDEEKIYTFNGSVGVCLRLCRLDVGLHAAWMHWSYFDVIVLGFKSEEELHPSPPLGVDSAVTSQLPKEKNLHGQFQHQITQPGSSNTSVPKEAVKEYLVTCGFM